MSEWNNAIEAALAIIRGHYTANAFNSAGSWRTPAAQALIDGCQSGLQKAFNEIEKLKRPDDPGNPA